MKKTLILFFVLASASSSFAETARGYIKNYRGYDFFAGLDNESEHVVVGQDFFTDDQWKILDECTEKHERFMTVVKYSVSEDKSDELQTVESVICVRNRTFYPEWNKVFGND